MDMPLWHSFKILVCSRSFNTMHAFPRNKNSTFVGSLTRGIFGYWQHVVFGIDGRWYLWIIIVIQVVVNVADPPRIIIAVSLLFLLADASHKCKANQVTDDQGNDGHRCYNHSVLCRLSTTADALIVKHSACQTLCFKGPLNFS